MPLMKNLLAVSAPFLASPLFGAAFPDPVSGDYGIQNFRFGSGETLPDLKIHYCTIGTPRRDAKGA
jgi:homoserine O-acetyltransferase